MQEKYADESVVVKIGKEPGKNIAIFAGIHGNETVGVLALTKAIKEIEVKHGSVYFVFANPEAIKQNVRQVNVNLNRLFGSDEVGETYEYVRVRKLMSILDKCEALLDIHASNSKITKPFIICRKDDVNFSAKLSVGIVSHGWDYLVPNSTDAYMSKQNKIGICFECGSVFEPEKNLPSAMRVIKQFLSELGAIDKNVELNKENQKIIEIDRIVTKQTDHFSFSIEFNDFDTLPDGKIFAQDGNMKYIAKPNECIIFPRPNTVIGGDAFIIGKID